MGLDITPIGAVADLIKTGINAIWPDKTEQEKAQLAAGMALIQGQLAINQTEASSSDPLQHWRGGLGWVCVFAYAWNFIVQPLIVAVSVTMGHTVVLAPLEIGPLVSLTMGMLGLGGLHVAERIKGAS